LVGDAAFGITEFMQKTFAPPPDPGSAQAKFYKRLTNCRRRVEAAFGDLKGRWVVCKRNVFWNDVDLRSKVIAVCCALHNFVVQRGCEYDERWDVPHPDDVEVVEVVVAHGPMQIAANEGRGIQVRNVLVAHLAG
jgi:hypothetical protein